MGSKVRAFETETLEQMEDELNKFFQNKDIIASPIFQTKGGWASMVYYREKSIEPIIQKPIGNKVKEPITDKQKFRLKKEGFEEKVLKSMTKQEAFTIIQGLEEKEKEKS